MAMVMATVMASLTRPPKASVHLVQLYGSRPRQLAVGLVTLVIAVLAISNALGNTVGRIMPDLAAHQLGADPDVPLRAALTQARDGDLRAIAPVARTALHALPLNSLALSALGVAIEQRGGRADRFMALSDRQSRRTALAQFWWLEHSVAQNDIPAALDRYDILMSLSSEHWATLLPVLDNALADPHIARVFAKHLHERRTWTAQFFAYMADQSEDPVRLARVVLLSGGLAHARALGLDSARLLDRLTIARRVDLVRALFLTDPNADRGLLQRPLLSKRAFLPTLAPVTWQLPTASAAAVFPEQRDGHTILRIIADPDNKARALRKLLFLPTGRYRLDYSIEATRVGAETGATWQVSCANNGSELGEQALNLGSPQGTVTFVVPESCHAILLDLAVAGGSDQSGAEIMLKSLDVRPTR